MSTAKKWSESVQRAIDPTVEPKLHAIDLPRPPAPVRALYDAAMTAAVLAHGRGLPINGDTLKRLDPTYAEETYTDLLNTPKFIEGLASRGINLKPKQVLTAEQLYVLQVMLDPTMGLSPMAKLRRLGIPFPKWQGWLHQPMFSQAYREMSERILSESIPAALTRLRQLADAGDLKAIKLELELTGRYNPNAQAAIDFARMAATLMESVQKNVSNDKEYAKIVADFAAMQGIAGVNLPGLPMLEAVVVEDEDSATAFDPRDEPRDP